MKRSGCYGRWVIFAFALAVLSGCSGKHYEEVALSESSAETFQKNTGLGFQIEEAKETAREGLLEIPGEEPETEQITLLFGGDVYLSNHVLNAYDKSGGIAGVLDSPYREIIGQADYFIANQEFPFSNRGAPAADKEYTFCLPTERVSILKEMGLDLVTLANNHALDYGEDAFLDTMETLKAAGIAYAGGGENLEQARQPVKFRIHDKNIAVLAATRVIPVWNWAATKYSPGMLSTYDPAVLLEEIQKAAETEDYVIVYVHWGKEKKEIPEDYQRDLGRQYIDAGADLVVGSHSHVLQGIEYYKGKPIVYSLGNFVFGSSIPRTALLKVELTDGKEKGLTARLSLVPGTSSQGYTRMMTDESERQQFFQKITELSEGAAISGDGEVSQQP